MIAEPVRSAAAMAAVAERYARSLGVSAKDMQASAAKARELYFLPGKFDAAEALRLGLVSKVSAAADFEADLAALTARLASAAPLALITMKANFLAAEKMGLSDFITLEAEKHSRLFQTEDTTEAFLAFVEKRPPVFQGR